MRMNVDDMDYKQLKMLLNNHYFDEDWIDSSPLLLIISICRSKIFLALSNVNCKNYLFLKIDYSSLVCC